ncbi:MAG: class I SAM-dependent methyltransferase [Pirellulaceae bacterium]|nr:class I SAM-dependent methyltransferase [Pirellulaceae bacterium]
MVRLADILDSAGAYRLWQLPFARSKFRPIVSRNELLEARRVLDVGCGPGTNAPFFAHAAYLGLDLNPRYIQYARQRFGRDFQVADVRTYLPEDGQPYDFILANSLFHHLDDASTRDILSRLGRLLCPAGHVHILDLVLPPQPGLARWLARQDRGDHPRPLERWRELFSEHFEPMVFEAYPVRGLGLTLWEMVYFKGKARQ